MTWHHLLVSWDLAGTGRMWLLVDGQGVTAELGLPTDRPAPNPGGLIAFGGLWGLPGDGVESSDCNLDDLRIQACTVAARLDGCRGDDRRQAGRNRLMAEEDLARAMLDQLLRLQFHGGWGAGYHWPTYTPSGWSQVGRGVDMWFAHSAEAAQALLRGWMIWGDDRYLDGAIEAADMFCSTQLENGSWAYHYTYSRGEFQRWGDHAYIAQAMQSNQIRFLCLMSRRLGYERYQQAIRKAGDWMASIQYPSGAWGWEAYPLGKTGPHGHPALNDAVTPQAMHDLFVIACATGEDKYLQPILRGAEWIIASQADGADLRLGRPVQREERVHLDAQFRAAGGLDAGDQLRDVGPVPGLRSVGGPEVPGAAAEGAAVDGHRARRPARVAVVRPGDECPRRGLLQRDAAGHASEGDRRDHSPSRRPLRDEVPLASGSYSRGTAPTRVRVPIYPDWRGSRLQQRLAQAPDGGGIRRGVPGDRPQTHVNKSLPGRRANRWPAAFWAVRRIRADVRDRQCHPVLRTAAVRHRKRPCRQRRPAARKHSALSTHGQFNWVYLDPARNFFSTPLSKVLSPPGAN